MVRKHIREFDIRMADGRYARTQRQGANGGRTKRPLKQRHVHTRWVLLVERNGVRSQLSETQKVSDLNPKRMVNQGYDDETSVQYECLVCE